MTETRQQLCRALDMVGTATAELVADGTLHDAVLNRLQQTHNDNRIMVVAYTAKGDSIVADQPKVWSEKPLADFAIVGSGSYDLAPDGTRVAALMLVEAQEPQQTRNHVIFLENVFDESRRTAQLSGKAP